MIYIRLHQAGNEEIEDKTSLMQAGYAGCKQRSWGNFARIAKFSLCMEISLHSEFSLC